MRANYSMLVRLLVFLFAAILVFARQRSTIASLEGAQKRDKDNKAEARRLHGVFGDFDDGRRNSCNRTETGASVSRRVPVFGPWLQKRREWVQRASESLRGIGLPDEAAAFRHSAEGSLASTNLWALTNPFTGTGFIAGN